MEIVYVNRKLARLDTSYQLHMVSFLQNFHSACNCGKLTSSSDFIVVYMCGQPCVEKNYEIATPMCILYILECKPGCLIPSRILDPRCL